ncbi:competence protein ComEC [Pedobacter sp. UYP30]|uniref:ComEC/Rec2 family competence protein n=1 Tax=Pedobacter sp. UYP30 TaxID=1756400 RepID=UPI0033971039
MFKAEYFFARILLPFLAGISLCYFLADRNLLIISLFAAVIILSILLFSNIFYKKYNLYKVKGGIGVLIFLFFFCFGGFLCMMHKDELKSDYFANQKFTYLKAWVNNEPQQSGNILRFMVTTTKGYKNNLSKKVSGKLLLAMKLDSLKPVKVKYGDELLISADYQSIEGPKNPAEFDFKAWLAAQNIYQQAFITQSNLAKTGKIKGNIILSFALKLRQRAVEKYRKLIKNDAAYSVASTLVLGYRADLDKETRTNFINTGTMHSLSVSGAHVGIIYLILNYCLQFLNKNKKLIWLKPILICLLIWGYALLTGLSPSVVRAAIMLSIFIFAKSFTKSKNGYNILAFAAFLQLLFNPFLIFHVGFQLSYIAVFGLLYLQPKIYQTIYIKNKWLDKFWNLTALSLAAQLATFPIAIYYFHQFPVYFLLGNLFISVPLVLMMYLGILVLIPGLSFLAPIFEWTIKITNTVLHFIASLPFSTFNAIWITFVQFLLLSFAFGLFIYAITKFKKRFLFLSLMIFVIYQTLVLKDDMEKKNQHRIVFFSLKKNYAAAFIKGNSAILVTDLNPQDKNYQFSIQPALDEAQITDLKTTKLDKDTVLKQFALTEQQLIFNTFRIFLLDKRLNYKTIANPVTFDVIWINNTPNYKLDSLSEKIKFSTLLIDATNRSYRAEEYENFYSSTNKEVINLKKQSAFLVDLNKRDEPN